jgi:hypothetical protein
MMASLEDPRITHLDDFRRSTTGHQSLDVQRRWPRVTLAPYVLEESFATFA